MTPSATPLEHLDLLAVKAVARSDGRHPFEIEIVDEIDSTNAELLRRPPRDRHRRALLAEHQTGGRGRRGRAWHSPFGRNVYLSVGWRFETGLRDLSFLPLAVAVASARSLRAAGIDDIGLKWPNDLQLAGRKLGGCLVEIQGDTEGPCDAVMGVGVNVHMRGEAGAAAIDQDWTDLASRLPGVSRNRVAGGLASSLVLAAETFSRSGFETFRDDWEAFDTLTGRSVTLYLQGEEVTGLAAGLGTHGGLLLDAEGTRREYFAGDATLRGR